MDLWIEEILGDQDVNLEELTCPVEDDVADGEAVIGTIRGRARLLKIAASKLADEMLKKIEEHEAAHKNGDGSEPDCVRFHMEAADVRKRVDILIELFWIECRRQFPDATDKADEGIGIRRDWQLVSLAKEEKPAFRMSGGIIVMGGR